MNKSVEKVIKTLRADGWTVETSLNKHYKAKISKENFKTTIVFSSTPSDVNAVRNIVKSFRKAAQAGGFHTLDNYRSYFITEGEFDDTLQVVVNRLTVIANGNGISEEAAGHLEVLQQIANVACDECFTDDVEAIRDWASSKTN